MSATLMLVGHVKAIKTREGSIYLQFREGEESASVKPSDWLMQANTDI